MSTLIHLFLAIALVALQVQGRACSLQSSSGKAIYFITNQNPNQVISLPIAPDGQLGAANSGTKTDTGGSGIVGTTATGPAGPDGLFSQSALTIAGDKLFAVNSGSNTLTMFLIDKENPATITMIGQPVAVPGEFPNTVAASKRDGVVCVGSSGAKAGVSCATFSRRGLGPMDALRPFSLGQTTPPLGPTNTVSQVFFSKDELSLFATVKGDPSTNKTGFLATFPVKGGCVSQDGVLSSPGGTAVLFGTAPLGSGKLFATDASFGAAVLKVDGKQQATVSGKGVVDGQKATCWVAVNPVTNSAFVTDVLTNRVVEMSTGNASVESVIDLSNGDPGLIDIGTAGRFLYALSPGNGSTKAAVTVLDAVDKKQIQHLELDSLGVTSSAQGMAVLK